LIRRLKQFGNWQMDGIWVLCGAGIDNGLINIANPNQNLATYAGSYTFTPYQGIQGDGSSFYIVSALNTGNSTFGNMSSSYGFLGCYNRTATPSAGNYLCGIGNGTNQYQYLWINSSLYYGQINTSACSNISNSSSKAGWIYGNRVSTAFSIYNNSTLIGSPSCSIVGLPNLTPGFYIYSMNLNGVVSYSNIQSSLVMVGGGTNSALDIVNLNWAVQRFKIMMGL
jgi:hypothetical protein